MESIRTRKTVSGVVHDYILNGSQIIAEEWGNNLLLYFYNAADKPIGMQYRNSSYAEGEFDTYWFEKNLQGDIIAVYDAAGTKLISYTYDAWGNSTVTYHNGGASTTATYNPFRYRGYYLDTETGFYYLNSRYYDPVIGRFINADDDYVLTADIENLIQYNLFAYCLNNPVNRVDSNGYWSWKKAFWTGVSVAAVGLAVLAAIPTGGGSLVLAGAGISAATATVAANAVVVTGVAVAGTAAATGVMYSKPSRQSDKERSTDKPSWVNKSMVDYSQTAKQNATRMMNDKYGIGNWTKSTSDGAFSKIVKWLTRSLGLDG